MAAYSLCRTSASPLANIASDRSVLVGKDLPIPGEHSPSHRQSAAGSRRSSISTPLRSMDEPGEMRVRSAASDALGTYFGSSGWERTSEERLGRRKRSVQIPRDPTRRSRPAASANARKSRSRVSRGIPRSIQHWAIKASPRRALRRFANTFARNSPARCQ